MNKKISIDQLQIGMYVVSMDEGWVEASGSAAHFKVKSVNAIAKLRRAGVNNIYIDISKGKDVNTSDKNSVFLDEVKTAAHEISAKADKQPDYMPVSDRIKNNAKSRVIGGREESIKAALIYKDATNVIREVMVEVRDGRQVNVDKLKPVVERIIQSVDRNRHALTGITRLKNVKDYVYMHSVCVASLLVTFAKSMELDDELIYQLGLGGLLHDVGKAMIPDSVINKVGKLTEGELTVMMNHVVHNVKILADVEDLESEAKDVATMTHERMDGAGYPLGLKGEEISLVGQMAAIVDFYDVMSSNHGQSSVGDSAGVLIKLTKSCPDQFDRVLVDKFIQCLGIYPVGSLVELNTGKVGIVTDQGADILKPKIRIMYDVNHKCYVQIEDLDLEKDESQQIVGSVDPSQHKINIGEFL